MIGEDYAENKKKELVSNYNSSGFINLRLHTLWVDANNHKRKGKSVV